MKPILFNTEMVRAILEGRKTATRRVANINSFLRPRYIPGDILYVRETWAFDTGDDGDEIGTGRFCYRADNPRQPGCKWRPSIHMPKEAARLFLRVTNVRVERLQDITELQILEEEGIKVDFPQPKSSYISLAYVETRLKPEVKREFSEMWHSTIKPADRDRYGWAANPWVWVIELERISKEEAEAALEAQEGGGEG